MKTNNKSMSYHISKCLKCNISVYPVYKNGFWYVEVDNDGTITTYLKKSIGKGSILKASLKKDKKNDEFNWVDAINKTWIHWSNLIDKNK